MIYDETIQSENYITIMAKRFNNLDAALKLLRSPTAGPDDEAPDAPAGSALKNYQLYKQQKKAITYTRASTSKPGEILVIALKPFALADADTTTLRTSFSKRANDNASSFGLSLSELGIDATLQETDKDIQGFQPAKAIARKVTGTTATTTTSKITGRPYKSKADNSYTFPVGRATGRNNWGEAKAYIISQVESAAGVNSVTFNPEKY